MKTIANLSDEREEVLAIEISAYFSSNPIHVTTLEKCADEVNAAVRACVDQYPDVEEKLAVTYIVARLLGNLEDTDIEYRNRIRNNLFTPEVVQQIKS